MLSQASLRLPFFVAASIALTSFVLLARLSSDLGCSSTRVGERERSGAERRKRPSVRSLLAVHFAVQVVSQFGLTMWIINGQERYGWSSLTAGVSLCVYGLLNGAAQVMLTPLVASRLQPWHLIFVALAIDAVAHVLVGLASQGWMFFALLPLLALPGPALPMLQSLISSHGSDTGQGAFQARVTQLTAASAIITPLAATTIYAATRTSMPGLVWIVAAAIYIPAAPFFIAACKQAKNVQI